MKTNSVLPLEITQKIREIQRDNIHGALSLTKKAVKIIIEMTETTESTPQQFISIIRETIHSLVKAQPTMAPIFTFGNTLLLKIDRSIRETDKATITELKKIVQNYCHHFLQKLKNNTQVIANHILDIIPDNTFLLTYSDSSTVFNALLRAHQLGKSFTVICSESRPMNEGTALAERLGGHGIKTILVTDAALFSRLKETQLIIIGADSININSLTHKIGTYALALLAHHHDIPFYSLCGTEKILPKDYSPPSEQPKNPAEILTKIFSNVTIENHYFDETPLQYVTGIITENGVKSSNEISHYISSLETHHSFIT